MLQNILHIAKDENFLGMEMQTIWTLVDTCIIPTILYGTETWKFSQQEEKEINSIFTQLLKRIIKTPVTTPNENILIETGYKNITEQIKMKKLLYANKIKERETNNLQRKYLNEASDEWTKEIKQLEKAYNLENTTWNNTKMKKTIKEKMNENLEKEIEQTQNTKSKLKYLTNSIQRKITEKPEYIEKLTRNEISNIFRYRARMTAVRHNFKGTRNITKCR